MPPKVATPKKRKGGSLYKAEVDDEIEEWKKSKQLLKPKDQVELQDAELKEIIGRNLVLTNPQAPDNLVEFCHATGTFVPVPTIHTYVVAFEMHGTYLHKDTDEGRAILLSQGIDPATLDVEPLDEGIGVEGGEFTGDEGEDGEGEGVLQTQPSGEGEGETEEGEGEGEGEGDGGAPSEQGLEKGEKAEEGDEETPRPVTGKKLVNQFNFCERAALTYNLPKRMQETQTVPPPMQNFSAQVLQWVIYDAYLIDFEEQMAEKERERERREREKAPIAKVAMTSKTVKHAKKGLSEAVQARIFEGWKVLERMINLNTYDDVAKDYRYWEDPSDEYREEEGTLLPLWKYSLDKTKDHTVTYLLWNPWYYDLFVTCFGYLEFLKPIKEGYICLYTIKNPSYPESICVTDSAVMCADIHPKYPYMLVCGLYDGNIEIFNIQATTKRPAFITRSYEGKHSGIIWAIKWVPDLPDGELNFYSVANDGKVNNYVLMQNELSCTTIINLFLDMPASPGPDGTFVKMKACATYIILHPKNPTIYLVGTEEGIIYKCSINYISQYLLTYKAHTMPIYKLDYNKFNSDIFISASGDWRIKIWEDHRLDPLFVFDLGSAIMDVAWAPYSSTIFAASTAEGKVYVFDLNVNKYKAICSQAIVSKRRNRLTTIAFNNNLPIIIVGDDKGMVTSLKLSPNLRIPCKAPKKQQNLDQYTMQCMKLDRLLSLVREPAVLEVHMDMESDQS